MKSTSVKLQDSLQMLKFVKFHFLRSNNATYLTMLFQYFINKLILYAISFMAI